MPDITNLITKTTLNPTINEVKGEIPCITNLVTETALYAAENKIPSVSNLVKKLTITQKLMKLTTNILTIILIHRFLLQNLIKY